MQLLHSVSKLTLIAMRTVKGVLLLGIGVVLDEVLAHLGLVVSLFTGVQAIVGSLRWIDGKVGCAGVIVFNNVDGHARLPAGRIGGISL